MPDLCQARRSLPAGRLFVTDLNSMGERQTWGTFRLSPSFPLSALSLAVTL